MFLSTGVPAVVTLSTFGCYIFVQKKSLTASTAFTAMSLFGLLREAVISATYLLSAWMRARVSLDRITGFLTETEDLDPEPVKVEERPDATQKDDGGKPWQNDRSDDDDDVDTAIEIVAGTEVTFSKYATSDSFTLRLGGGGKGSGPLRIPRGQTTIIAGDVGSGKSAFLLAILGELHLAKGEIKVCKDVDGSEPERERTLFSYAAQSPWLQGKDLLLDGVRVESRPPG